MTHDGRVFPNEAKTWDRMGEGDSGPHPLGTALEQWLSFATGKHTWVSVRGATIRGLISARRRAKGSAWEVDCLINADEDQSIAAELLDRMTKGAGKQGAERVFLRLAANSCLFEVARAAGFFVYTRETLYRADEAPAVVDVGLPLRKASRADAFGIYQLYSAATPSNVRAIEGVNFRDWQAAREPWGGRTSDWVLEDNGLITGWLRIMKGQPGRLALLVHPDRCDVEAFLRTALVRLRGSQPLLCLAPAGGDRLSPLLLAAGFDPSDEFVTMAKRLAKLAGELTPETIGTTATAT
jgi:hypothetical protein